MNEFFVALAAGFGGYLFARRFVSRRLRFVDAVQSRFAPLVAAVMGALAILPLTALPLVTLTTAMVFGIGAGLRYRQRGSPRQTGRRGAEAPCPLSET